MDTVINSSITDECSKVNPACVFKSCFSTVY